MIAVNALMSTWLGLNIITLHLLTTEYQGYTEGTSLIAYILFYQQRLTSPAGSPDNREDFLCKRARTVDVAFGWAMSDEAGPVWA
jgi:hypothetical protein